MVRGEHTSDRPSERIPLQWAMLAAALAVTAAAQPALAQEAVPAPTAEEQDPNVLLEADALINDENARTITAEGDVQVRYQGRTMRADRIVYDLDTGRIRATGNVEIVERDGSPTYAEDVEVDEELTLGVATELQSRFAPQGSLAARTAIRREDGRSELGQVIYTSCPLCEGDTERPPTWTLRARRAVQDPDSQMISYRDAVLEVAGIPVLYAPYFAHPDPTAGPRSGFLVPDLGRNRRLGTFVEIPYYWAISPYQDLTVTPRVHSQVNPLLGFEYRKRFWSGDLRFEGSFTHEQDFDSEGVGFGDDTFRSHLFGQGRFVINDYWRWGFGIERASDDLYLRRYDLPGVGQDRGPYIGDQVRLISQAFVQGQGRTSYVNVSAVSFQGLREGDNSALLPLILPVGEVTRYFTDPLLDGQLRLQASTAVLARSDGADSARASADVQWRRDYITAPGIVISPFAQGRVDLYRIGEDPATSRDEETFERTVGLGGVEVSWPFLRAGERVSMTIEPVVMAAYGSQGGNDPRILNEDSIAFELDESNLFRPNAAPNFDLWEPGGRVAAGLRATALTREGRSATLVVGRRWREEDEPAFDRATNLDGTSSDWVGGVFVDAGPNFGANIRTRLDEEALEIARIDGEVRGRVGVIDGNLRYVSVDSNVNSGEEIEEITARIGAQLVRGWRVDFGLRRDLDSDVDVSQSVILTYADDCTLLEFSYTRSETSDRRLGPNEGFRIRVGLTTLGLVGGGD
jgi:LPS-assembly protein